MVMGMVERRRKPPSLVAGERRRRNRTYGNRWRKVREVVLCRDRWECQIRVPGVCRGRADQVDHIRKAKWTGPVFDPNLLRSACRPCNNWVAHHGDPGLSTPACGSGEKFPSRADLGTPCPHRLPDGRWCVGLNGHWSQWFIGSPDDPPQGKGDVIA
jgi:hypothetical protein